MTGDPPSDGLHCSTLHRHIWVDLGGFVDVTIWNDAVWVIKNHTPLSNWLSWCHPPCSSLHPSGGCLQLRPQQGGGGRGGRRRGGRTHSEWGFHQGADTHGERGLRGQGGGGRMANTTHKNRSLGCTKCSGGWQHTNTASMDSSSDYYVLPFKGYPNQWHLSDEDNPPTVVWLARPS